MNIKMFNGNNLPYELLLIRQTTWLRNAFENNMSTNIKLSRTQIPKIIQSGGFVGSLLSKLAKNWQNFFCSIWNNRCYFSS